MGLRGLIQPTKINLQNLQHLHDALIKQSLKSYFGLNVKINVLMFKFQNVSKIMATVRNECTAQTLRRDCILRPDMPLRIPNPKAIS